MRQHGGSTLLKRDWLFVLCGSPVEDREIKQELLSYPKPRSTKVYFAFRGRRSTDRVVGHQARA
jgi:hypothetical protein